MTATRIASAATIGFGGVAALALASGSLLIDPAPTTVEGSAHSAHPHRCCWRVPQALSTPSTRRTWRQGPPGLRCQPPRLTQPLRA